MQGQTTNRCKHAKQTVYLTIYSTISITWCPEEDPHRTEISYLDQSVRQFGFLRCPKKGPNGLIRYWFDAFLRTRTISKPQISAVSASGTNTENGPLFCALSKVIRSPIDQLFSISVFVALEHQHCDGMGADRYRDRSDIQTFFADDMRSPGQTGEVLADADAARSARPCCSPVVSFGCDEGPLALR